MKNNLATSCSVSTYCVSTHLAVKCMKMRKSQFLITFNDFFMMIMNSIKYLKYRVDEIKNDQIHE